MAQAIDPQVQAMWDAWLGGGENPFGVSESDVTLPYLLPPAEDPDEEGFLDNARDRANLQQDKNDLFMDNATIAQLGTSPGGARPEDFVPTETFEPIDAPGYMLRQYMLNGGDPVQRFIAEMMADAPDGSRQGVSASMAINLLKDRIKSDPDLAAEMSPALPRYTPQGALAEEIDWQTLTKTAENLEKLTINDPAFPDLDDGPGGTGMPGTKTSTLPEIGQAFKDAGIPSPYETYSPDILAKEMPQADGRVLGQVYAENKADEWNNRVGGQLEAAQDNEAMVRALINERTQGRTMDEPVGGVTANTDLGGPTGEGLLNPTGGARIGGIEGAVDDATQDLSAFLDRNLGDPIEAFFGGDTGGGTSDFKDALQGTPAETAGRLGPSLTGGVNSRGAGGEGRGHTTAAESSRSTANRRRAGARAPNAARDEQSRRDKVNMDRAMYKVMMAKNEQQLAQAWARHGESNRNQRGRTMNELTARGYTPYNNTVRGRQSNI